MVCNTGRGPGFWTKHCGEGCFTNPFGLNQLRAHASKWDLVLIPPTSTCISKVCTGCAKSNPNILFSWHIRIIQHPCHDTARNQAFKRLNYFSSIIQRYGFTPSLSESRAHVLLAVSAHLPSTYRTCASYLTSVILCSTVWVLWVLVKEQLFPSQWLLYCDYRISWLGPSWFFFFKQKRKF